MKLLEKTNAGLAKESQRCKYRLFSLNSNTDELRGGDLPRRGGREKTIRSLSPDLSSWRASRNAVSLSLLELTDTTTMWEEAIVFKQKLEPQC